MHDFPPGAGSTPNPDPRKMTPSSYVARGFARLASIPAAALFVLGLASPASAAPPPGGYTLAFEDNFDGTALDTTAWGYRTDARSIPAGTPQCANLARNVSVSGGFLRVAGVVENYTTGGVTYPSTGGGVISKSSFKYGYYETRARLTALPGWHSSFWQIGGNNEIDGWEVDSHAPRVLGYNTHYYESSGHTTWQGASHTLPVGAGTADMFRVYGWEWTPTEVIFYVDNVVTARIPYPGLHSPQAVWLTCLGWDRGHGRQGPVEIQFDYLRYYAKDYGIGTDYGTIVPTPALSGTWGSSTAAYNQDGVRDSSYSQTPGSTATWQPTLASAGSYEVFFWNPSYYKATTRAAKFTVFGASGVVATPDVDQVYDGQQWVSLGAYKFNAGSSGFVRLTVPSAPDSHSRVAGMMFRSFDLADLDFDGGSTSGWTAASGTWSLTGSSGSYAYRTTSTGEAMTRRPAAGWQNHFVRASMKIVGAGASGGVVGRCVDPDNYYLFRLNAATDTVDILERVGGVWSTLATASYPVSTGVWYDLLLVLDGTELRGLVNGFECVAAKDSSLGAGTIGLRTYGGEVVFDRVGAGH